MELDWLETFLAVLDRGGFTAASSQVHRSQSRVSAHIAALERELGVRLIDRGHRPATVTEAGRMFANHARAIIADVGTARSAVAVVRALTDKSIAVRTRPGIGATLFPVVFADVLLRHPDATITLAERDCPPAEPGSAPAAVGGTPAAVRLTVDTPQTLAVMVRAGLGVGVTNVGSRCLTDRSGLTVLEFAESPDTSPPGFDVALDWFDVLLTSPVGRDLHSAVLGAPAPAGAVDRRSDR